MVVGPVKSGAGQKQDEAGRGCELEEDREDKAEAEVCKVKVKNSSILDFLHLMIMKDII